VLGHAAGAVPALPAFNPILIFAVLGMGAMFLIGNLALQYGASRLASSTTSLIMLTEIVFASLSSVWLGAAVL
jgi:drug/metabolite transporter (DMT)-like permease